MTTLRSRYHPADAGAAAVQRVLAPLAAWVLLPMTIGLVQALTNGSTAPFWWTAALTALGVLLAARWRLDGCLVEVSTVGGIARLRSLLDVLRRRDPPWEPVTRLRRDGTDLFVDIGTRVAEFDLSEWPDPDALLALLRDAHEAATSVPLDPLVL